MIYVDTSALGAVFFREATSGAVAAALRSHSAEGLVISGWTLTEMASVGAIKERAGTVSPAVRAEAMRAFQRFASTELQVVEVEAFDYRGAASLVEKVANLRAGDALHVAIAHRLGAKLATLDLRLGQAASACGVRVMDLAAPRPAPKSRKI